jgi:hypothetical protein
MKANYLVTLSLILSAGLLFSCSKKEDDDHTSTGTYKDLSAVFEKIGERQKLYKDLAPVELPDFMYESGDTMVQKIVSLAELINSSREIALYPEFDTATNLKKAARIYGKQLLTSAETFSDGEWEMECFLENTPHYICKFTKWENDGKLKVVLTDQGSPEAWLTFIIFDGEDSDGENYDGLMIQSWITLKDLTLSEYTYSANFYPNPPCSPNVLWQFINEVEGKDAWLHFMGETISLATYIYTVITYTCDQIDGYHVWTAHEMRIEPDGTLIFTTSIYSLKLKMPYKWRVYVIDKDKNWSITVYDEYGNVTEHKEGPA